MIRTSNRAASAAVPITPSDGLHGAKETNGHLRGIVERIEKKEQVRQGASADIREIYTEARSQGVNVPALRNIVRERTKDPAKRAQVEAAMQAYRAELGMIAESVGDGEMSIREAAMTTGFSRSAIHRELSHRKEIPVSGTVDAPTTGAADDHGEVSHSEENPFSGTADAPTAGEADDLSIPQFLRRERLSP